MKRLLISVGTRALVAGSAAMFAAHNGSANADDAVQSAVSEATGQAQSAANDAQSQASNAVNSAANTAQQATNNVQDSANQSTSDASKTVEQTTGAPPVPNPANVQAQGQLDTDANAQLNQNGLNAQNGIDAQGNVNANGQRLGANANGQAGLNANNQANQQWNNEQLGISFDQQTNLQSNQGIAANQASRNGLVIREIQPNSVLFNSGLRRGDVLLSIDNRPLTNQNDFGRMIATYQNQRVPLMVLRDGRQQTIYFNRPADFSIANQPAQGQGRAMLGVTFDSSKGGAAVVRMVTPGSPAEQAGIMAGDVITGLNGQKVTAYHEVVSAVAAMSPGQQVAVDVSRQNSTVRANATLASRAEPIRQSVGYAPDATGQTMPAPELRGQQNGTYHAQPTSRGDTDGDGRRLDGDGRMSRRAYRNR